jgi:hypothetical protein
VACIPVLQRPDLVTFVVNRFQDLRRPAFVLENFFAFHKGKQVLAAKQHSSVYLERSRIYWYILFKNLWQPLLIHAITGGTVLASGYLSSTNQSRGSLDLATEELFKYQLTREPFTSTPQEITLAVTANTNTSTVHGSLDFQDITH